MRATVTIRVPDAADSAAVERFIDGLPFKFGEGDEWLKAGPLKTGGRRRHPDRHVVHAEAVRARRARALRHRQSRRPRVPEPDTGAACRRHRHHPSPRLADGGARDRRRRASMPCSMASRRRRNRRRSPRTDRAHRDSRILRQHGVGVARGAARRARRHATGMALQGRRRPVARAGRRQARALHRAEDTAAGRRRRRDQHRSHVRARLERRPESVQPAADDLPRPRAGPSQGACWAPAKRSRARKRCA